MSSEMSLVPKVLILDPLTATSDDCAGGRSGYWLLGQIEIAAPESSMIHSFDLLSLMCGLMSVLSGGRGSGVLAAAMAATCTCLDHSIWQSGCC